MMQKSPLKQGFCGISPQMLPSKWFWSVIFFPLKNGILQTWCVQCLMHSTAKKIPLISGFCFMHVYYNIPSPISNPIWCSLTNPDHLCKGFHGTPLRKPLSHQIFKIILTPYVYTLITTIFQENIYNFCAVSKWRPNNWFSFRVISISAKIWKTTFQRNFSMKFGSN